MITKNEIKKLVVISLVSIVAGATSFAADLSAAEALRSSLSVQATAANLELAAAAAEGDPIAIAAAQAKVNDINAALAAIDEQIALMEAAIAAGDEDAADAAFEAIQEALDQVLNVDDDQGDDDQGDDGQGDDGVQEGEGNGTPNIYKDLGDTQEQGRSKRKQHDIGGSAGL
eukprot:NODE_1197_length_583_cov_61.479401_g1123_i0.p1 GENE.NODE_1197_length_583_cov_61.479401_g1123_i0~~NODE_1197_length_583_cov_61.479401_g1123_i0.p1  ORF type:complete len:172 (-),score=27.65 NODE_1197_length_583_cov_61.479401_g1123_i0:24-539(-)